MLRNFLIISLLLIGKAYSQPVFENDTSYRPYLQFYLSKIEQQFNLEKNYDFEFQFSIVYSKTMKFQTLILTLKDATWSARFFERPGKGIDTLMEIPVNQSKLFKLWKRLEKKNILTIPQEEDVRDEKGNEINDPVHDGIRYYFSFVTTQSKRGYSYICPRAFSEDYKKVKAFKQVVEVATILFRYLGINPDRYLC